MSSVKLLVLKDEDRIVVELVNCRVDPPPKGPSSRTLVESGSVGRLSEEYEAAKDAEEQALGLMLGLREQIRAGEKILKDSHEQIASRLVVLRFSQEDEGHDTAVSISGYKLASLSQEDEGHDTAVSIRVINWRYLHRWQLGY